MAAAIDRRFVTIEEFEAFKQQAASDILALHKQHLDLLALMKDAHEREKQALLAMSETLGNIIEHQMGVLLVNVVEAIKADRETHQPVHIN